MCGGCKNLTRKHAQIRQNRLEQEFAAFTTLWELVYNQICKTYTNSKCCSIMVKKYMKS